MVWPVATRENRSPASSTMYPRLFKSTPTPLNARRANHNLSQKTPSVDSNPSPHLLPLPRLLLYSLPVFAPPAKSSLWLQASGSGWGSGAGSRFPNL